MERAVKQVLEMIEQGELKADTVRQEATTWQRAKEYGEAMNPFVYVVGEVYSKALPFLPLTG